MASEDDCEQAHGFISLWRVRESGEGGVSAFQVIYSRHPDLLMCRQRSGFGKLYQETGVFHDIAAMMIIQQARSLRCH